MTVFTEFALLKKINSDPDINFTLDMFRQFSWQMNIEQAITSSCDHYSNGQVKACLKFITHTVQKCLDINNNVNLALLLVQAMPIGTGLPSLTMLLFNTPMRDLLPEMTGEPIDINNDDTQYETLNSTKINTLRTVILAKTLYSHRVYSSHTVRRRWTIKA